MPPSPRRCQIACQALRLRQRQELPAQPQQRQHDERQRHARDDAAHQLHHGAADEQRHDTAPQQRGEHRPIGRQQAARLAADGDGGVAHHHQFKRAPAEQLHDVEHDRQARERAAVDGMHQPGAGQAAVAADLGHPAEQAGAEQRAKHDGQQRILRAHGGHQVRAHLHHQQAHAQAEPQRGVVVPLEDAAVGANGGQRLVGGGGGLCHERAPCGARAGRARARRPGNGAVRCGRLPCARMISTGSKGLSQPPGPSKEPGDTPSGRVRQIPGHGAIVGAPGCPAARGAARSPPFSAAPGGWRRRGESLRR